VVLAEHRHSRETSTRSVFDRLSRNRKLCVALTSLADIAVVVALGLRRRVNLLMDPCVCHWPDRVGRGTGRIGWAEAPSGSITSALTVC